MDQKYPQPLSPEALRKAARDSLCHELTDVSNWTGEDIQSLVSELELHQEELRIQNEELLQTRDRLDNAREMAQKSYRDLFELAPMGILPWTPKDASRRPTEPLSNCLTRAPTWLAVYYLAS
ncbi:hypothetical protein HSBAA_33270 [Vreelandella sulfidaeris]|uniref:Uncharacterized protein n=1 Tax=Vreelandella sulfidaeris TaxID=115553 RepID=A0A455UBT4_9GAMM|nr:hypothetical protein HSBAA_33270 [Halomonas sulfidaeris]